MARGDDGAAVDPAAVALRQKPKGRRDLLASDLPRVLFEIRDEELEKTGKLIGWDYAPQLMYRRGGWSILVTQVGNLFSDDESSKAWFSDFASGNFAPSAASPLIGAGSADYGVPTDIDGKPRVGGFDSGAYQH